MASGRKGANTWIFSRGTEWKKEIAYRANGMWVFQRAASGAQPAASGAPVMKTLEAIRVEAGGCIRHIVCSHHFPRQPIYSGLAR